VYCDRCGGQAVPDARFCSNCGRALAAAYPSAPPAGAIPADAPGVPASRVNSHLRTLGILWLISGILRILSVGWLWTVSRLVVPSVLSRFGPGFAAGSPLDRLVIGGIAFASGIMVFQAVLAIVAAWGLLERQSWGRVVGIFAGVLSLWNIPFGTALGIYTLWVLLPASSELEYRRLARA